MTILVLSLLGDGLAASPPAPIAGEARDAARAFRWLAVRVVSQGRTTGSGVVVRGVKGNVLVASAVAAVGRADTLVVLSEDGRDHPGRVVARDLGTGLALILIDRWVGPRAVDIDDRLPAEGEELVVYGYDRGRAESRGVVLRTVRSRPLRLEGSIPSGFEGGPVITLNKRLAAILVSRDGRAVSGRALVGAIERYLSVPVVRVIVDPPKPPPEPARIQPTVLAFPAGSEVSIEGGPYRAAPFSLSSSESEPGEHAVSAMGRNRLSIVARVRLSTDSSEVVLFLPPNLAQVDPALASKVAADLSVGDARAAEAALRQYLSAPSARIDVHVHLATALWLQEKPVEAIAALRRLIHVAGKSLRSLEAFVLMGVVYDDVKEYGPALTAYKSALMVHPDYAGLFASSVESTPGALRRYERESKARPRDHAAHIRLGRAYELVGRHRDGARQLRAVVFDSRLPVTVDPLPGPEPPWSVRTFPNAAFLHVSGQGVMRSPLVGAKLGTERVVIRVKANGYLEMAKSIDPGQQRGDVLLVLPPVLGPYGRTPFAETNIEKGVAAFASGAWEEAAQALTEALGSDQTLYRLWPYIGIAWYMGGGLDQSLTALHSYLRTGAKDDLAIVAFGLRGVIFETRGMWQDALTAYKLALALHPKTAGAKDLPAPRTDREIADLTQLISRQQSDPSLRFRLGMGHMLKGRHKEGASILRDALFLLGSP